MLSGDEHSDGPHVHTRVSVGQLRSALLQQTGNGVQPEGLKPEVYALLFVSVCVWVGPTFTLRIQPPSNYLTLPRPSLPTSFPHQVPR